MATKGWDANKQGQYGQEGGGKPVFSNNTQPPTFTGTDAVGGKTISFFGGLELYLLTDAALRILSALPHASGGQIRRRSEERLAAVVQSLLITLSWGVIS